MSGKQGLGIGLVVGLLVVVLELAAGTFSDGSRIDVVKIGATNPDARAICANYRPEWPIEDCLRELVRANPGVKIYERPLEDGLRIVVPSERVLDKICRGNQPNPNKPGPCP